jgi:hypothetical protein
MSKDYARSLDKIHHKILQELVQKPENSFCADCGMRGTFASEARHNCHWAERHVRGGTMWGGLGDNARDLRPSYALPPPTDPTWASANLGIFLCLNCSGCHRSLGVHISQVRSITMDAWFPDQIEVRLAFPHVLVRLLPPQLMV